MRISSSANVILMSAHTLEDRWTYAVIKLAPLFSFFSYFEIVLYLNKIFKFQKILKLYLHT